MQPKRKEVEDQRMWNEAKTAGTMWSYAAYLEKVPEGKHKSDAEKEFSSALETMVKKLSGGKNGHLLPGSAFPVGDFTGDEVEGALGNHLSFEMTSKVESADSSSWSGYKEKERRGEKVMQMISLVGVSQSGRLMFARKPEGNFVVSLESESAENGTKHVNVKIEGDGYAIVDDIGRKTVYEFRRK